ncbi:hypothetical protein [Cronobacter universalis]|uniref:hypothetical protein n=1 Tax=Cronobacter universalis TaxID=535744 RepID=UPI003CF3B59D
MHSENNELVNAGHELAKCLDNEPLLDIAKLLSKMATQLGVTTAALREKTKQCEQIAQAVGWVEGGNFTLAEAVAGHVSGLKAATQRSEELAAENAALKSSRAVLAENTFEACNAIASAGFSHEAIMRGLYESTGDGNKYPKPITTLVDEAMRKLETPATNAFIAEQRAVGVDMFGQYHNFSEKLFIQKEAQKFAAKLRQGGAA